MTEHAPSQEGDATLMRLIGALLIASGVLLVLLCGGCTLNMLRASGGLAGLFFAPFVAGPPIALGAGFIFIGYRRFRLSGAVRPAVPSAPGARQTLGWTLIVCGGLGALFTIYKVFWDLLTLINAMVGSVRAATGAGTAFFAALGYALLFALAAGVMECGRQALRGGRGPSTGPGGHT